LLAASFLLALVADLYRPAAQAMIADLVAPAARPYAFTLMYVAINLGFAIAPALGGWLAQFSFRWLFIGDAGTSCVYGLIILLAIRETLPGKRAAAVAADPQRPEMPADVGLGDALRHIAHNRPFLLFCLAGFLTALVYVQSLSTFPLYLQTLGIGSADYGRIIAINGVLIVLGQIPMTAWVARFDRGRMLALASLLVAIGFGANGLASSRGAFALLVVVWTIGEMLQAPLFGPIVSDLAPTAMRARYMGVAGMCYQGANMVGAPLGGLVLARAGGGYIWMTSALVASLAGLLYWSQRHQIAAAAGTAVPRPARHE
jgi:MFS family permease